jgi:hypothetical protein
VFVRKFLFFVAAAAIMSFISLPTHAQQPETKIPVPADYREWIYMTSGIDMTYAAAKSPHTSPSVFDNVFVNPEAWHTFKQTGTWPDGTTFVLENRMAQQNVSINRGGHTQGQAIDGIELHQKRAGHWTFTPLPTTARNTSSANPLAVTPVMNRTLRWTQPSCSSIPPLSPSPRRRTHSARHT